MQREAYEEMAQLQKDHWWFRGRREILQSVIASLSLPELPDILEIGAGTGGNLRMLSTFGHVKAVELDDYARSIAIQKTGGRIEVKYGRLPEDIPFGRHQFDLLCLFDVLEHVQDDAGALKTMRELVTSGGYAVITVPAYQWMWGKHDERLRHFRRYQSKELLRKASEAGWVVSQLTYFNTLLFPLALCARFMDKIFPSVQPRGTSMPAKAINALMCFVFSSEKNLLRAFNLPFGMSLLAVLKAP